MKDNVKLLRSAGYKYIIGARIKNEKKEQMEKAARQNSILAERED